MFSRKMIKSEKWTDRQMDTDRWMDGQTDRYQKKGEQKNSCELKMVLIKK